MVRKKNVDFALASLTRPPLAYRLVNVMLRRHRGVWATLRKVGGVWANAADHLFSHLPILPILKLFPPTIQLIQQNPFAKKFHKQFITLA